MDFLRRLAFYLTGIALGSAFVFLLFGNRMSCAYFPNARVLEHMNARAITYSQSAQQQMRALNLDTTAVRHLLRHGRVNFSKSEPRKTPCKTYWVRGDSLYVRVRMCRRKASATVYRVAHLP